MHFLFITSELGTIGGLEVLIARMSKWLLNKGHRLTLLTDAVAEFVNNFGTPLDRI